MSTKHATTPVSFIGYDIGNSRWLRLVLAWAMEPIMTNAITTKPSTADLVRNSLLYRQFQAQREEILKHKWYESERAGHDIGFDRALANWTIKHRSQWFKRWRMEAHNSPA